MTTIRVPNPVAAATCAAACLAAPAADAQRFQALYGNPDFTNQAFHTEANPEFDVYMSNGFVNLDNDDFFVVQKDPLGNVVWSNRYGAFDLNGVPTRERGFSLVADEFSGSGYALAGFTNARAQGQNDLLQIMLVGVDEDGSLRFSRQYIGTGFTDPVHADYIRHTSTPGFTVEQSKQSGDYYVTAHNANNQSNRPMILRTDVAGNFIQAVEFGFPQFDQARVGFTDIVEIPAGVLADAPALAVSGSLLRPTGQRDLLLLVTDLDLNPIVVRIFDTFTVKLGTQFPASATGHGIDFDEASGRLVIAGVTDMGAVDPDANYRFAAPHVLTLDASAGFAVVDWSLYDHTLGAPFQFGEPLPVWETDYASVRFVGSDADARRVAVAGTFDPVNQGLQSSAAFVVNAAQDPLWSRRYLLDSVGRGVAPALDCGVAIGGHYGGAAGLPPQNPFGPNAEHFVKTGFDGLAACFDPTLDLRRQIVEFEVFDIDPVPNFLDGDADLLTDPIQTGDAQLICFRPTCGLPCPGDANGDGLVNADDLLIVLGAFGTTCP